MLGNVEKMSKHVENFLGKSEPKKINCDKKLKSIVVSKDARKDVKNVPSLRTSLNPSICYTSLVLVHGCMGTCYTKMKIIPKVSINSILV
jgi:hypothetical protein